MRRDRAWRAAERGDGGADRADGGGTGLCSHFRGVCTEGPGRPEDRGSLFHAVEITISEAGAASGRVLQAFDRDGTRTRRFGAADP